MISCFGLSTASIFFNRLIGINGGVFKNKKLKFGVNCFGKPPHVTRDITTDDYFSKKLKYEAELQKYFKENQDKYTIFPTTK